MKATSAWSSASTSTGARGYNARQGRGEWGALGRTRARGCGQEGHAGRCLAGCLPSPAHGVAGGAAGARRSGHGPKRPFWTTPPRMPTRGRRERALPPRTLSNTVCASGHFRHSKLHVRPLYFFGMHTPTLRPWSIHFDTHASGSLKIHRVNIILRQWASLLCSCAGVDHAAAHDGS